MAEIYSNVIYVDVKEKPPVGRIVIVSYPKTVSATQNTPFHIKFTIKNEYPNGRYVTGKIITHKGTVFKKSQPLLPGQSKEFDIFIPGDEVAEKGTYYWKIQACMDEWKVEDEKTIIVTVKPPVGKVIIVEYPETIELLPDEAVYFDVKVRNEYLDYKLVRTELIDHEGKVRKDERKIAPRTADLISFYHPAIGVEGTYMWRLRVTNLTDGKVEDEKTITVTVKKPEKPKYKVTIKYTGLEEGFTAYASVHDGEKWRKLKLPVTVETTGYLRIEDVGIEYPSGDIIPLEFEYDAVNPIKWAWKEFVYACPPDCLVKVFKLERWMIDVPARYKKIDKGSIVLNGISGDGTITLVFKKVLESKYREVEGTIVESNGKVRFKWKCPICGHVNEDVEDKDVLEYLDWRIAEMCDICGVQSYIVLM
ncbi:hypothetical protein DRO69_02120 [Candidatus Bathyarchaeota archaeon]|nr:MAG: hypothetical protein DRO69_02120 [Candidatus Bathyarchaeota archaeon]